MKIPLKYRFNVIGGGLIIFVLIRMLLPQVYHSMYPAGNMVVQLLVYSVTLVLSCLAPIAFIENMCHFHPVLFSGRKLQPVHGIYAAFGMLFFTVLSIVNSILLIGLEKLGIVFPPNELNPVNTAAEFVLYFIFAAVIPAVVEELFVRGIVLNLLLPNGRKFAVLASALVFTVMHTQVQSFIPVFGAGVLLACIYLHTDNIFSTMLLHFINNAYSFIMLYMQQRVNGISSMGFASFVMMFIIVGGISAAMWLKRNNTDLLRPLLDTGRNSKLSRMVASPVMVLGLFSCLMAVGAQLYADLAL